MFSHVFPQSVNSSNFSSTLTQIHIYYYKSKHNTSNHLHVRRQCVFHHPTQCHPLLLLPIPQFPTLPSTTNQQLLKFVKLTPTPLKPVQLLTSTKDPRPQTHAQSSTQMR